MKSLPSRLELLQEYLNWFWLRPENALLLSLRGQKYASTFNLFRGNTIDVSCGDGAFSFIASGGRIDPKYDMFSSINISNSRKGNFDTFDHYDESYAVKVLSKPYYIYNIGTDWKQTLLNKASKLDYYQNLKCHDNNEKLPFKDCSFDYVYSNSAYWVKNFEEHIADLFRITNSGGSIVLELKTSDAILYSASNQLESLLGKESCEILDAGRISTWRGLFNQLEYESIFSKYSDVQIVRKEPIYGDILSQMWDVGLRPLFRPLVRLANSVDIKTRIESKLEFCDVIFDISKEFIENYVPNEKKCIEWLYVFKKD